MLRLLPKHTHIRWPTAQFTDPVEFAVAEDKVLLLAQSEKLSIEVKQIELCGPRKKKIVALQAAIFFPLDGLAEISFETKTPVILILVT